MERTAKNSEPADQAGNESSGEQSRETAWDEMIEQSFPASDPPPNSTRIGPPETRLPDVPREAPAA